MSEPLDPLLVPLRGLRLIEASAGTGKTYTIGLLYLRLLLEARQEVDRLLVVTFTNAATEELRGRIRSRVVDALSYLEQGHHEDGELVRLMDTLTDRNEARTRLSDALVRMDELAVYTIHGFCQRVLMENAFESGAPFEAEFLNDEQSLRREIATDLWRALAATDDRGRAQWLLENIGGPDHLLGVLARNLSRPGLRVLPREQELAGFGAAVAERFAAFVRSWPAQRDEIRDLLTTSDALNRRSYSRDVIERALAAADELAGEPALPDVPADVLKWLTNRQMTEKLKSGANAPTHPIFDQLQWLQDAAPVWARLRRAEIYGQSRQRMLSELARRKNERRSLFFDDLLTQLHDALQGAGGEALAGTLAQRFPVAMIDEFQDTDALQYAIFRRIYQGRPDTGLFLIGDPKQAIYGFRGGDIHTYISARRDVAKGGEGAGQYTLGTNWRSARTLVTAVNQVFRRVENPFLYAPDIDFHPVESAGRADDKPLRLKGEVPHGLDVWYLPAEEGRDLTLDEAGDRAASACAGRIAEWLRLGRDGHATLGDRALRAGDMAVLVRSHFEAIRVQAALRTLGIASVTQGNASVFQTEEAEELLLVLHAIADGGNEGLLRAALATRLLGATATELGVLIDDEDAWEQRSLRFQGYRDLWTSRGVMVALQALIRHEQVGQRLLARPDGERRMTNLLQLSELAQVASRSHPGPEGLLRWLQDQRAGKAEGDEQTLRLESDEALVHIVTIHKSKGLEYPIVFLPFPWNIKVSDRKEQGGVLYHDEASGDAFLDFGSEAQDAHLQSAQHEELAENLRLLYVALTRARHHCVICWGQVRGRNRSALATLLAEDEYAGPLEALQALAAAAPEDIRLSDWPESGQTSLPSAAEETHDLSVRTFARVIDTSWRVSSYSALAAGRETERPDHDPPETRRETQEPETVDAIFRLPGGTRMGHCLHELFENLDFPAADEAVLQAAALRQLERYGFDAEWQSVVAGMAGHVLDCPLDGSELRLRRVAGADKLAEMEFHFPVNELTTQRLRSLLHVFPDYAQAANGLDFERLNGLLKGFIDLVFRADGRYYVIDYKSNNLGKRLLDYGKEGLRRAIGEHRYDLQYLIYSVALHRLLAARLPEYDYETHFGGVYYLFLRGIRAAGNGEGVWFDRPPKEVIVALSTGMGGGA
ncbi:MAG: exodeoxyribonuclease V subunit beta [Chromatiales bacterium]|nr:exodeoxyribonuclease V subunit beta [Chromatiales bacterium]